MFGVNYINGSVQWLGVPDFLRNDGPPWTDHIYWLPVLLGETVVLPPIRTGEVNLMDPMAVLLSHGVVPSMPFRLTSAGVWKYAQRCAPRL